MSITQITSFKFRQHKALAIVAVTGLLTACGGGGGGGGSDASAPVSADGPGNDAPTAVLLSNTTVVKDVAGAEVGRVKVEDPDVDVNFRINFVSIDGADTSKFELAAAGAVLKLKSGESLSDGQQEEVILCVNSCSELQRTFTITADTLPNALAREANNFYPAYAGMEVDVTLGSNQTAPQPLTLTFAALDTSGAYPLEMNVKVPSVSNASTLLDASITEYMVSKPATSLQPLGELVLKRYNVFVPSGVARLNGFNNPAMTINIELQEALTIFSQALLNNVGESKSIKISGNSNVTITNFGTRVLAYTAEIAIDETSNTDDGMTLPEAVDVSRSARTTYNIALNINLDLSSMPSFPSFSLPDAVRVQSNMTLAEGVGFTERTLSVVDVSSTGVSGGVLDISGTFNRGSIDKDADPDDDLWLNSVDRYPNNASAH